jgi:hypothetical protein
VTQVAEKSMLKRLENTLGLGKSNSPSKFTPDVSSSKEVHFGLKHKSEPAKKEAETLKISDARKPKSGM